MLTNKINQKLFSPNTRKQAELLAHGHQIKIYSDQISEIRCLTRPQSGQELTENFDDLRTYLRWEAEGSSNILKGRCICDVFQLGQGCSHLWALITTLPPSSVFLTHPAFHTDFRFELDLPHPPQAQKQSSQLREWQLWVKKEARERQEQLDEIDLLKRGIKNEQGTDLTLWYGIDLRAPAATAGRLELPIFLYSSELMGKLKSYTPMPENRNKLTSKLDREIVSLLEHLTSPNLSPYWRQRLGRYRRSVCFLPRESLPILLSTIAQTGRLFLLEHTGELPLVADITPLSYQQKKQAQIKIHINEDQETIDQLDLSLRIHYQSKIYPYPKGKVDLARGLAVLNQELVNLNDDSDAHYFKIEENHLKLPKNYLEEYRHLVQDHLPLTQLEGLYHLNIDALTPKATMVIEINFESTNKGLLIYGQIFALYPEVDATLYAPLSSEKIEDPKGEDRVFLRDLDYEQDLFEKISELEHITVLDSTPAGRLIFESSAFYDSIEKLTELNIAIYSQQKRISVPRSHQNQVAKRTDWFEIKTEIHFEVDQQQKTINLEQALKNKLKGPLETLGMVDLGDQGLGLLPEKWLQKQLALLHLGQMRDQALYLHQSQALALELLLDQDRDQLTDISWGELHQKAREHGDWKNQEMGPDLLATPRQYQKEGIAWLNYLDALDLGGCLADDMGLGKTLQVLAFLDLKRHKNSHLAPHLIIVPKTLMTNWQREAEKFTPKVKVYAYEGPQGKRRAMIEELTQLNQGEIVLTTYGTMRRDATILREIFFDTLIFDEAQIIKDPNALTTKSCKILKARNRFALTGTPAQNRLSELMTLFSVISPKIFGKKVSTKALDRSESDLAKKILTAMSPFILRRTKDEVLTELPTKTQIQSFYPMPKEQADFYFNLKTHYQQAFKEAKKAPQVFEALLRLRQAACHPALIDPTYQGRSAKLEALVLALHEIKEAGAKALVFSQFTSLLELVGQRLKEEELKFSYLDGKTSKRQEVIDQFTQDSSITAFLLSIKTAGHGLNLTCANYAFILDPWWNPTIEAQAIDRIYRMGQTSKVFAYKMIAKETIEEKILVLQESKTDLINQVQATSSFDAQESARLMGLLVD